MVLKLLEPTSGTVTYEGKDISGFQGKELLDFRRHVQPVFQNPYGSLDPMYSIYRSIEEPLRIHGIGDKKSRAARVRELLDMVELRVRAFPLPERAFRWSASAHRHRTSHGSRSGRDCLRRGRIRFGRAGAGSGVAIAQ